MKMRVDAADPGDRVELVQRLDGFDLDDDAQLGCGDPEVVRNRAVAAGALRAGDAAHAVGRVAGVGHRPPRLAGVLHEREHQRLRAGVERALDHHHVVPRHAGHRRRRRAGDGAQDVDHLRRVDRHVLHVDDDEVEAGAAHRLRGGRRGGHQPGAELALAGGDGVLEMIAGQVHGGSGVRVAAEDAGPGLRRSAGSRRTSVGGGNRPGAGCPRAASCARRRRRGILLGPDAEIIRTAFGVTGGLRGEAQPHHFGRDLTRRRFPVPIGAFEPKIRETAWAEPRASCRAGG